MWTSGARTDRVLAAGEESAGLQIALVSRSYLSLLSRDL